MPLTSPAAQLRALLGLRWRMVRRPGVRLLLVLVGLLVVYLAAVAARSAPYLEPAALASAVELAPAAFLGFAVLAVVAPLGAGGGTELLPPDQLVAYPVRPTTQFLGSLALAPMNLVWVLQLLALTAETAYLSQGGSTPRAALTTTAYVGCVTVLGQALAWSVAGLRQTAGGRRALRGLALLLLATAALGIRAGLAGAVLRHSPTRSVVRAVSAAPDETARWGLTTLLLLVLAAVGLLVGSRLCGWALRRPRDAGASRDTGPVRRRAPRSSALRELVAVNRASAWRAPAVRRGGLVLAILPGVAAAGAEVPWPSLTVLPGLVAAGAGLLFGVNAFALDASGALWLASLPHQPLLLARAKAVVLAETVLGAVALVIVAGALRSPGTPDATQLLAIGFSALACTAVVVAVGMSISVRRPHHAPLAGPRDAIAPPGALALASVQLSAAAGLVGVLFEGVSRSGTPWLPPLLAVPVLLLATRSLRTSLRRYADLASRSRVVSVVSSG